MSEEVTAARECISVNIVTKEQLYRSYMSYVKEGALFIPTKREFNFGDHVLLKIQLIDEKNIFQLPGEIIWITPPGAQYGMNAGIGVRFLDGKVATELQSKISTYLAGLSESDKLTDTM